LPKSVKTFRLAWTDGTLKVIEAASIDEAVAVVGKGYPWTYSVVEKP
jgi:hypothetical protein